MQLAPEEPSLEIPEPYYASENSTFDKVREVDLDYADTENQKKQAEALG